MAAALACLAGGPAAAQPSQCAPHEVVVQRLAEAYGETRRSAGPGANNTVVEIFASHRSGSWTITVTDATGLTCLIAAGQNRLTAPPIPSPARALPRSGPA